MRFLCRKAEPFEGRISLPGDKSISHRAGIIASLAEGESRIENFHYCRDCLSTLRCLQSLGVEMEREGEVLFIRGKGLYGLREANDILNAGNSGTTMRLLAGVLSGQPFLSFLTGDSSLRRRPMDRIKIPLEKMGATIWARQGRFPPLAIMGGRLRGMEYELPVASAQVKSAILLAGLLAEGETLVRERSPSRDHTERMLAQVGADIEIKREGIRIRGGKELHPLRMRIPGDFSSASFFITLALLTNSHLRIEGVGVNPTRTGMLEVLREMGARVRMENLREEGGEPVGDIEVEGGGKLRGVRIDRDIPLMIDELPVLAVLSACAEGETEIRGAEELRYKETDRIRALRKGLTSLGIEVEERKDGLFIKGGKPRGGRVRSFGDHRIAMSFTILALASEGESEIQGAQCVDISFPAFYDLVKSLVGEAIWRA